MDVGSNMSQEYNRCVERIGFCMALTALNELYNWGFVQVILK
jgi:hypothetical protein